MSAIVGLLFDEAVFIGTDTLATRPYQQGDTELKPFNFVHKVFQLPHFKSAFAYVGYQHVGARFYQYLSQMFVGKDINSIISVGLDHFKTIIDASELAGYYATVYLYGYDDNVKKFKGYRAHLGHEDGEIYTWIPLRSFTESPGETVFVMSPPVEGYWDKIPRFFPEKEGGLTYEELVERLVILQKYEDGDRAPNEQVGIGGEVVLTTLYISQNHLFAASTNVVHQFFDKETVGNYMMDLLTIQNGENR